MRGARYVRAFDSIDPLNSGSEQGGGLHGDVSIKLFKGSCSVLYQGKQIRKSFCSVPIYYGSLYCKMYVYN
jgi:hypothetical protein